MTTMTRAEIEAAIPHRAPFLWLDEVLELEPERILARKFLDPELDVFRGHYPAYPVLPGVLQCEMCFQAGAILISRLQAVPTAQVPVVTRVNDVRFRRMLRPGMTVEIEVVLTEKLSNAYFMTGKVLNAGKTVTRLEFACTAAAME